jgi:hypothetical protein
MAVMASILLIDTLGGKVAGASISVPIGSEKIHLYNNTNASVFISLTEAGVDIATQRVELKVAEGTPIEFILPAQLGQHTLFVKAGDGGAPGTYLGYVIV